MYANDEFSATGNGTESHLAPPIFFQTNITLLNEKKIYIKLRCGV